MMSVTAVTDYPAQFQHYLTRHVAYMLSLVQQAVPVLPDELRVQALHTLSYALHAQAAWEVTRELIMTLAPKLEQGAQREDWIPYLKAALQQSLTKNDKTMAGECHLQLAILYRLLSQFTTAHTHLQAALDAFATVEAKRSQARVLNELAWLEHLQKRYADAGQHVDEALALLNTDDPECGMSYRVQGMIAADQGRWHDARKLHNHALTIFEEHHDQRRVAWSLQNLANALRGQQQYSEATAYYQKALTILSGMEDIYHLAIVHVNLGTVYSLQSRFEISIKHYLTALTLTNRVPNKLLAARIYTSLGLDYLAQHQVKDAEIAMLMSIQLYEEVEDQSGRLNAMDGLVIIYLAQQAYTKAATLLEQALTDLPQIIDTPSYAYLHQSFHKHQVEVQKKQGFSR